MTTAAYEPASRRLQLGDTIQADPASGCAPEPPYYVTAVKNRDGVIVRRTHTAWWNGAYAPYTVVAVEPMEQVQAVWPRPFVLVRDEDVTGVSGTGIVAEGAAFLDGTAVLRWCGDTPTSVVWHDKGVESIVRVHGHGGRTRIVWTSQCPPEVAGAPADLLRIRPAAEVHRWEIDNQTGDVTAHYTDGSQTTIPADAAERIASLWQARERTHQLEQVAARLSTATADEQMAAGLPVSIREESEPPTEQQEAEVATCRRCDGCRQIANDEEGAPWTAWTDLPAASQIAIRMGLVSPIPCPDCAAGDNTQADFIPRLAR